MPKVYKSAMVRMFHIELTNLRRYGSRSIDCRNAIDEKSSQVWQSKNADYEMPYSVTDTVQLAGSEQKSKNVCS